MLFLRLLEKQAVVYLPCLKIQTFFVVWGIPCEPLDSVNFKAKEIKLILTTKIF